MKNKEKNKKKTIKRLFTYFAPYKLAFITIFFFMVISTILSVYTPKILGNATTSIFNSIKAGEDLDYSGLKNILIFLLAINFFSAIFNYLSQYMLSIYSQKIVYNLRSQVNEKLSRLPLNYYDTSSFGDFLSRVTNDVDNISNSIQQSMSSFVSAIVLIISVIVMMLSINLILTLIALLVLPISMYFVKIIVSKSQHYFKERQSVLGELNGQIEESFSSLITVKAYHKEKDSLEDFASLNHQLKEKSAAADFLSNIMMPITIFISNFAYVVITVVGALLLLNGKITIGNIQAFLEYTKRFRQPISRLASISTVLQKTVASADRVFEMLDEEELDLHFTETLPADVKGNISFNHVKFGYTDENILMKDVDFKISAGESVAIIGPTGAGKTTLVNLLMRFYDLKSGSITLDGMDIKKLDRADLRRQFGMVLQDTWLFHGSIYDNIAYGNEEASREDVMNAAKLARAHDFIQMQSDGYDTIINEEASNISVGEKQLITIARAILSNPKILILDEATSSVDTRTELLIKEGLYNLSKGKTTFMIAHRLSTIKDSSKVIRMEEGNIVDIGTYESVVLKST